MAVTPQTLSLDEFLELPEEKPALEYIDGRMVQKVSPQWQHAMLQFGLAELINRFGRLHTLAMAFPERRAPGFELTARGIFDLLNRPDITSAPTDE